MDVPRYYQLLQVLPDADPEVVAAAYRALARKHHPDMDGGDARRMRDINEAWEILQNASLRAAYNEKHGIGQGLGSGNGRSNGLPSAHAAPTVSTPSAGASGPLAARRASNSTASVIDFGRYEGWRLDELIRQDRPYVEWLARTPMGMRYRAEIYRLMAGG
jgi:curved DNA-binding protein CbpA